MWRNTTLYFSDVVWFKRKICYIIRKYLVVLFPSCVYWGSNAGEIISAYFLLCCYPFCKHFCKFSWSCLFQQKWSMPLSCLNINYRQLAYFVILWQKIPGSELLNLPFDHIWANNKSGTYHWHLINSNAISSNGVTLSFIWSGVSWPPLGIVHGIRTLLSF